MKRKMGFLLLCWGFSSLFASSLVNPPLQESTSLHLDWLDTNTSPGQNFYAYANGAWQKKNPIPPAYASWDNFRILQQKTQNKLHQMLTDLAENPNLKKGSIEQKIGDFYYSGMNEAAINKEGVTPLKFILDKVAAVKNINELQEIIPELQLMGVDALFNFGSMQDFKNSEKMIGAAFQGGLGLPDRDYYSNPDEKFVHIREAYRQHVAKMLVLLGDTPKQAAQEADTVMAIETILANASLTQSQQRDPLAIYHVMNVKTIDKLTPNFSWSRYMVAMGLTKVTQINLAMPQFFKVMNAQLKMVSIANWKIYLRWQIINAFAPYLSQPFVEEAFHMDSIITGTKELLPRWQRVINTENSMLDFAMGKLYVEHYFSAAEKQQVLDIIQNIRQAFRIAIHTQKWMTPVTRKAALKKLDLMQERVGYPDQWRDYSSLMIDRGPYILNVIRAHQFQSRRELNKIGKPVDRSEWSMAPQMINAYYDPSMNNINILAGILQPPFFDPKAPAAVNYGAIGFVIGHEMTHGFDDQGALFDGNGNLNNWWTASDLKQFKAATQCISEQFSHYKVAGNIPLQGQLVVGEASADLGGILLAYNAFINSKDYQQAKIINGFTPQQQFFLSAAHVWAGNMRPELMRHLATTDPHPPMMYRVNGSFANILQFQQAFKLKNTDPMINKARCSIW